jgi:hypothetical protein
MIGAFLFAVFLAMRLDRTMRDPPVWFQPAHEKDQQNLIGSCASYLQSATELKTYEPD